MSRASEIVPLVPNNGQLMMAKVLEMIRAANVPARVILLKPRRVGWTTWSCADAFYSVWTIPNFRAFIVSADDDSTMNVFGMVKLFQSLLPEESQRPTDYSTRKELVFSAPHYSSLLAQTAGKVSIGRSFEARFLLCTEVAFWTQAATRLASLYQIVARRPGTTVILESTANSPSGAFYDTFWESVERWKSSTAKNFDGSFVPVFFPWFQFGEYSIEPPENWKPNDEVRDYGKRFELRLGQLFWMDQTLAEMNYDWDLFSREYPGTAREAFRASGNPVFSSDEIAYQESFVVQSEPRRAVLAKCSGGYEFIDVEGRMNCWQVRDLPQSDKTYVLGLDTMEARLSDPKEPKSKLDYDAAAILCRETGDVVAIWQGRSDQTELAKQVLMACCYYQNAWFVPEIPNSMLTLSLFKERGYQNVYNRLIHEDTMDTQESESLGFRTNVVSRKILTGQFKTACYQRSIRVRFSDAISQMARFVYDKAGTPKHMPGQHDDILFAIMLALQGHFRCPHQSGAYMSGQTGKGEKKEQIILDNEARLSQSGAVDTFDPETDDDGKNWVSGCQVSTD